MVLSANDVELVENAFEGNLNVVRGLLLAGANVNAQRDTDGATALLAASGNGHLEIVHLLLGHDNVDVNAQRKDGETALVMASRGGHSEVVRALRQHSKLDVNVERPSEGTLSTSALLPLLYRAIAMNAGKSDGVLGEDIDDVIAKISATKSGKGNSAVTRNAGECYVVQDEDIDDVLIVLSTIKFAYGNSSNSLNALQKYTLHPECIHDLIGKIRAMKVNNGSSDPNVAGHELPCSLCNETPTAVKCWAESHPMCALCIDDAVVNAPVSTTDDFQLPCQILGCSSQPFTFKDLYKHIHVNVWSSHLNKEVERIFNEVKKLQQDT